MLLANGVVLPSPTATPGAINAAVTQTSIGSTICAPGWTTSVRPSPSFISGVKRSQLAAGYSYRGDTVAADYEEDHLIPLELGGSPTAIRNLWPQPLHAGSSADAKDRLEAKLRQLVCAGQLSLATAQHAIAANWFTVSQRYGSVAVRSSSPPISPPAPSTSPAAPPTSRPAPVSLTCTARMSNAAPAQYSTVEVLITTGPNATVTVTAHYRTTDTTHSAQADASGAADVPFRISRATLGYEVTVEVNASTADATASCQTSFTPQ